MMKNALLPIALLLCSAALTAQTVLAPVPPMGWNSYDAYGTTASEADIRNAARWIATHLKPYGWQYVVIDMEWFVTNPTPSGNGKNSHYALDDSGRYVPATNRFPSAANGAGFKPLADYIHSLGLKLGIHMLRGIPKQTVEKNEPIAGSSFHARDAADTSDVCPWNPDNYGVEASKPAAQAYYDSVAKLYADWGVDFVKVDCIASHPYKGDDIRMFSEALRRTGRPIVLSLSPGPAPLDKTGELRRYAQMWRISDDVWDLWHSDVPYPQGLGDQFARAAQWAGQATPGHWPDADMLPLGYLGPAPGWGKPRMTQLTHDEQRTFMTLWCIFGSPLMWGGNPEKTDPWTVSLLTNREVLNVDQRSKESHVAFRNNDIEVWVAQPESGKGKYVAVFNLRDDRQHVRLAWKDLSLPEGSYVVRDLWQHRDVSLVNRLDLNLPPHGSELYRVDEK